jgi:methionyl-tRNA synthetase
MEKFRINDTGTIEIRLLNDRIQFTTTPDHQETIAEVSKANAIEIANKLLAWAKTTDENSGLHLQNVSGCYCMYCEKKLKSSEVITLCKKCTE